MTVAERVAHREKERDCCLSHFEIIRGTGLLSVGFKVLLVWQKQTRLTEGRVLTEQALVEQQEESCANYKLCLADIAKQNVAGRYRLDTDRQIRSTNLEG